MDSLFVPTAEAAFIAGVSDREMNRAVDERILPDSLVQSDDGRRFARLGAALAGFYFKTEDVYVAPFRRRVLREIMAQLERIAADVEALYALKAELSESVWQVEINSIRVDLARFVDESTRRVKEIDRAESLISTDPQIMGGVPVFAGTRVGASRSCKSPCRGAPEARAPEQGAERDVRLEDQERPPSDPRPRLRSKGGTCLTRVNRQRDRPAVDRRAACRPNSFS